MFLKKIEIENFKGHTNCELKLKPGFNLLIGDNGMGKTAVLEAISVALGGFKLSHDPEAMLPILSYQSAARTWMQKKESSENIFRTDFNRTVGYINCLEEASD